VKWWWLSLLTAQLLPEPAGNHINRHIVHKRAYDNVTYDSVALLLF